jgi:hypothetical protein
MPKGKQLNNRERILLKSLAAGKTYADAARDAGYSERSLRQSGFQAFQSIRRKMPEVLERKGFTDDAVVDNYLRPALEAEETEFAKFEGKITDQVNVVAWGPRLEALDMLFRLKGSYAPREDDGARPVAIQIINHIERPQRSA